MPLLSLAAGSPARVLEIGCGKGQSLVFFKEKGAEFVAGVECVQEVAAIAQSAQVDQVIAGDIETLELPFAPGEFDLIIVGHVLEHLKDPWSVAIKLRNLLKPTGQLIGSLPNVRNVRVSIPLLFLGEWRYREEGILDWTHTKFFTRSAIEHFFQTTGFVLERIVPEFGGGSVLANKLTLGIFGDLFAWAYNFSARPGGPKAEVN